MFTILARVSSYDSSDHRFFTHNERIVGLFQTLKEAKEAALSMAQPIFNQAFQTAIEEFPEEIQKMHGPCIIDPMNLPYFSDKETGVSVEYCPSSEEASKYYADNISHLFLIKEIETAS